MELNFDEPINLFLERYKNQTMFFSLPWRVLLQVAIILLEKSLPTSFAT